MEKTELMQEYIDFCKKTKVKTESFINDSMTTCITKYPFKNSYIYEIETINDYKLTDSLSEAMLYI